MIPLASAIVQLRMEERKKKEKETKELQVLFRAPGNLQ